ncbi:MAG: hypothetical protein ACKO3C_15045 [Betaproteobacteria bacterium]
MSIKIDHLNEDELLALNHRIITRLRWLQQQRTLNSMVKFEVGQRVSFDADGRLRTGIVIKFNPKTLVVMTDEGQRWKVSPQFLREVIEDKTVGLAVQRRLARD